MPSFAVVATHAFEDVACKSYGLMKLRTHDGLGFVPPSAPSHFDRPLRGPNREARDKGAADPMIPACSTYQSKPEHPRGKEYPHAQRYNH
jgi:hypothetical protein